MTTHLNGTHKKPEIAFDDDPPKPGPNLFIKRMKGNESMTAAILGSEVRGVWHHWNGRNSEPHFRDESICPGCLARRAKRWKGYLHVFDYGTNQQIILELTNTAARSLWTQLGKKTNLRGERVRVTRTKSDSGRLQITVLQREEKMGMMPPEIDPRPVIVKLWGIDDDDDDAWLGGDDEKGSDQRFKL